MIFFTVSFSRFAPSRETTTAAKLRLLMGGKKTINRKHIDIFLTVLVGQSSLWDEPPPVPGTNGTEWRFYCGIRQRKAGLSQGRVPICPGEGSRLSQGRFLFVPETVPPKMFMFIGFFLARFECPNSKWYGRETMTSPTQGRALLEEGKRPPPPTQDSASILPQKCL